MNAMKIKRVFALSAWVAAMTLMLAACDNGLEVQQDYGFDLETMPVQDKILPGETAEIRCTIVSEGDYDGTRFFIRYFQPDGRGDLRLDDGTLLVPNDLYPLDRTVFRLYYTSRSTEQQTIDIYIEDLFGKVVQKSFSWQNENADDEDERR